MKRRSGWILSLLRECEDILPVGGGMERRDGGRAEFELTGVFVFGSQSSRLPLHQLPTTTDDRCSVPRPYPREVSLRPMEQPELSL